MNWCRLLLSCSILFAAAAADAGSVVCPAGTPVQGAPVRGAEPMFPADNWWNLDIRSAPVDANSAAYIAFINNGGTRRLHPDFGGEETPGSIAIYGMPYAVVSGSQTKVAVTFQYWDESDGVDLATGQSLLFYPIPTQAITQPHWVEGGAAANVDQRSASDRHLLMVDCTHNALYELYNVWFNTAQGRWYAGSGAFFDMNTNGRRPEGWTSADAAGLAIFPGLVRYDEVYNPAVTDLGHALRVTVRATNGYVWPASHRAGSTAGALPMGARLRLKALVNGADPALRSSDAGIQKIFRAMQKHGLIVADNGSDLYITGTFDTRWNNDVLNPAFALLSASDFEVVQLGWKPGGTTSMLSAMTLTASAVAGGSSVGGTVTLSAAAPAGGATVLLGSSGSAALVPSSVAVAQGATSAAFTVTTQVVSAATPVTISASYAGVTRTATLTVNPVAAAPTLSSFTLAATSVRAGNSTSGTVTLSAPAPAGGAVVSLTSGNSAIVKLPTQVSVTAGATSARFSVGTARRIDATTTVPLTASWQGKTASTALTVVKR